MGCCNDAQESRVYAEDEVGFKPTRPRGCTDVLCLMLFIVFWALLLFLAVFAFAVGNPLRVIYGADSFGNICGRKNDPVDRLSYSGFDMRDKPYLFYLNAANISHSLKICVKVCPDEHIKDMGDLGLFYQKTNSSLCRYDYDFVESGQGYASAIVVSGTHLSTFQIDSLVLLDGERGVGPCPKFPVSASKPVLNRCIPTNIISLGREVVYSIYAYLNSFDTLKQVVADIMTSWREIHIMVSLAIVLSFVTVILIHYMAAVVSWIILVVVSVSLLLLTSLMWWTYVDLKYQLVSTPYFSLLEENVKNEKTFLVLAIITTVITILLLLLTLVIRKRVQLVVALFKEAGACIRSMPLLMLQPIFTFIALSIFLTFWLAVLLALATADYPEKIDIGHEKLPARRATIVEGPYGEPVTQFGQADLNILTWISFTDPSWVHYMWWYHVIALLWTCEFILGCQQMVIAGSVASWYFTRDKSQLSFPIGSATRRLFFYHLGSIAFGSFLITLFKFPRIVIAYVEQKLKKYQDNALIYYCLRCCSCFLWLMEKFLKYLNHNAYTVIAIEGTSFCTSAQIAFNTIVSNALRVATINSVGDFILFLGKCGVTALTAFAGILLLRNNEDLHFYAVPIVVASVFSFFIAHCVLSVYEMVIDTLFLCFCEDYNKNDGTPGKEYYAPPSLLAFLLDKGDTDTALKPLRSKQVSQNGEKTEE